MKVGDRVKVIRLNERYEFPWPEAYISLIGKTGIIYVTDEISKMVAVDVDGFIITLPIVCVQLMGESISGVKTYIKRKKYIKL